MKAAILIFATCVMLVLVFGEPVICYLTTPKYEVNYISTDIRVSDFVAFTDTVTDTLHIDTIPGTKYFIRKIK